MYTFLVILCMILASILGFILITYITYNILPKYTNNELAREVTFYTLLGLFFFGMVFPITEWSVDKSRGYKVIRCQTELYEDGTIGETSRCNSERVSIIIIK